MGKKDLVGKEFFADPKRFAELLNNILYHGEKVVCAEGLESVRRVYPSPFGKGEMGRDVFMRDVERSICYGLELETESDRSMPERVMVYDACELEWQIKEINKEHEEEQQGEEKLNYQEKKSRMKETDILWPVVTAVLYLGTDHWEGKKRLSELYGIPEEHQYVVKEVIPDYGFPLAEADFVNADAFRTDLKEFFQAMQCRKDKAKLKELLSSERFRRLKDDTAWTIAAHLDRKRLKAKTVKGGSGMCIALEELLKDERMEGRAEGKAEGKAEGEKAGKKEERLSIVRNMLREGLDKELIRKITGCSPKELIAATEE